MIAWDSTKTNKGDDMTTWDIEEMVAQYNDDLLEGEEAITYDEMEAILSE
jgi:hypothetical protein